MSQNSTIEWTDATWNPVRGCSRVSPGCLNCYAEKVATRFSDPGQPFHLFADRLPKPHWTGKVDLVESHLMDPLKWRKPKRIFVNSMSDLFHEGLSDEQIDRVFAVMALCPQHTFQVLTKRPERMLEFFRTRPGPVRIFGEAVGDDGNPVHEGKYRVMENGFGNRQVDVDVYRAPVKGLACFAADIGSGGTEGVDDASDCHVSVQFTGLDFIGLTAPWPLPNVWLGVSVENQATADARIPLLLQVPAAVRFVSYEPALGPIEFRDIRQERGNNIDALRGGIYHPLHGFIRQDIPHLDWIIVGGESGPGARPFEVAWARNTVEQCAAAGVACFVKQLGRNPGEWVRIAEEDENPDWFPLGLKSRKGSDMSEWPEDVRVREFPKC